MGLREAVEHVANVLYPGIRAIIADAVMQRSERCASGLELRRRLHLEMSCQTAGKMKNAWKIHRFCFKKNPKSFFEFVL